MSITCFTDFGLVPENTFGSEIEGQFVYLNFFCERITLNIFLNLQKDTSFNLKNIHEEST